MLRSARRRTLRARVAQHGPGHCAHAPTARSLAAPHALCQHVHMHAHAHALIRHAPCAQEALRLKEGKVVDEVVAVSAGPQQVQVSAGTCMRTYRN